MEKMTGKSMDLIAENIAQMKALFPEAVTEGKIDFEVLKALLGGEIEKRQTYYKFTWNGKEEARAYARIPSMGTLRPCVAESSGKDGTPGKFDSDNLYIEGDNLEVLKLLQGPYHKRVKMIYIDPPYNTGHDFVYPDNFRDSIGNYKSLTGQTDEEGAATRANPETSGRYHTDWLNMMYPRLILARNLLTDDGVIFISIDDSEQDNLKKLCNEVFGEENFVALFPWRKRTAKSDVPFGVSQDYEWVLTYSKTSIFSAYIEGKERKYYQTQDFPGKPWRYHDMTTQRSATERPNCFFTIVNPKNGKEYPANPNRVWANNQETFQEWYKNDRIIFPGDYPFLNLEKPVIRYWKSDDEAKAGANFGKIAVSTKLPDNIGMSQDGTKEITNILGKVFSFPKPISLTEFFCKICTSSDSIILDFFSGSATTAHAVMQLNAEDGGNRKFILVQLPEVCEEGTEAAKAGYKNICEIGKERIRRAAKKIQAELSGKDAGKPKDDSTPSLFGEAEELSCNSCVSWSKMDFGFKVFKLDTSNIVPWNPEPEKIELSMRNAIENILIDRTVQDLLYEVLLKCNLPLTLPIEEKKFGANTVYVVGAGALAICLDCKIPQTIAEEIVKLRDEYAPIVPMQVVFRDNGFTDVSKTNALQILKQAGFEDKSVQTI